MPNNWQTMTLATQKQHAVKLLNRIPAAGVSWMRSPEDWAEAVWRQQDLAVAGQALAIGQDLCAHGRVAQGPQVLLIVEGWP